MNEEHTVKSIVILSSDNRLYECGDEYPIVCPVCNGKVDFSNRYLINHLTKSYECLKCKRLFVTYLDWICMPNRELFAVEHDKMASAIRDDVWQDKKIERKIHNVQKQVDKLKREGRTKVQKQTELDEKRMQNALKERNGEPLGNRPKQRKRSIFS